MVSPHKSYKIEGSVTKSTLEMQHDNEFPDSRINLRVYTKAPYTPKGI